MPHPDSEGHSDDLSDTENTLWHMHRIPLGEDQPHLEILPEVIRNYGLAVQYGHRHIFQSLPRLLTLWFDFGSHIKSITVTQKACPPLLNAQALLYVLHLHCITCSN